MTTPVLLVPVYTGGVAIRGQKTNFSLYTAQQLTYESTLAVNMNASISGINALIPEIEAAANAASLSNFVGLYSSLTGALDAPASAYHLNQIWTLTEYVADVTLEVPGTSSKWVIPTNLRTGVDITTSAVDVTLTYASKTVQYLSMTSSEKFVILPSAIELQEGAFFDFFNNGAFRCGVKNSAGGFIGSIEAQGSGRITLIDNSTTAGTWRASDGADVLFSRLATVTNAVSSTSLSSVKLNATTILVAWRTGTKGQAQILTWVSATPEIVASNVLDFYASTPSNVQFSTCRMTDTVGIIGFVDVDGDGQVCAVTYTPGTNTLAAAYTYEFKNSTTISSLAIVPIYEHESSGKIGVLYNNTDVSTSMYGQVLNWTGSEITSNTAETSTASGHPINISATVLSGSEDAAVILSSFSISSVTRFNKLTWSTGNTLTFSSPAILANYGDFSSVRAVNSTYAVIVSQIAQVATVANLGLRAYLVGADLAVYQVLDITDSLTATVLTSEALTVIDVSNLLFVFESVAGYPYLCKIKITGTPGDSSCFLKIESQIFHKKLNTGNRAVVALDAYGAIHIEKNGSGYVTANRIEVG